MMRPISRCVAKALSVAAAVAVLPCAPVAGADPDDPTPSPSSPSPTPDQPPNIKPPKLPSNPPKNAPQTGDLADKNCWVIDGVPTWNAPGTAPRPITVGETAVPCYFVYGLQPH